MCQYLPLFIQIIFDLHKSYFTRCSNQKERALKKRDTLPNELLVNQSLGVE